MKHSVGDGLGAEVRPRVDLGALDLWMEFDLLNKIQAAYHTVPLVAPAPGEAMVHESQMMAIFFAGRQELC